MDEEKAKMLAQALGGDYFNSGGGVYLVYVTRQDGKVVAFGDELVAVYDSVDNIGDESIAEIMLV